MLSPGTGRFVTRRRRVKPAFRRQPLFSNIPGSFPLVLLAILVALVTVPLRLLPTARQAEPAAPPAQIETRVQSEGYDQHHRAVPFTVYVLSQHLSWKLESVTDLDGGQTLLSPELQAAINRARDVLCVGTASYEGATRAEEARAARRAQTLVEWVAAVMQDPQKTRLYSVNAGQYKGPRELASASQRKAIIIATEGHAEDADLSEALSSGLARKQQDYPIIYSLLHHYSRSADWLAHLGGRPPPKAGPSRP